MWPFFEQALARYRELEAQLSSPDIGPNLARLAREHGALARKVKPYLEYRKLLDDIASAEAMLAAEVDPEVKAYGEEELAQLRTRRDELTARLEEFLLAGGEDF